MPTHEMRTRPATLRLIQGAIRVYSGGQIQAYQLLHSGFLRLRAVIQLLPLNPMMTVALYLVIFGLPLIALWVIIRVIRFAWTGK